MTFLFQNSAASFTANYRIDFRWWSGNFQLKLASVWQVGGVHFPPCILSSYRISSGHTTPFMGEQCVKGTSRYVVEFPAGEKFPLCFSLHQRALRLEIAANLSFISWLKFIQAWRYWYANGGGSAAGLQSRPLSRKPWLRSWYISLSLTQWPPCQWSMWASGSTEGA